MDLCQNRHELETSGSCAIVSLVIEDQVWIANVGDSRAVLSADDGDTGFRLSEDHKPDLESEKSRIERKGGEIYRTRINPSLGDKSELGPF